LWTNDIAALGLPGASNWKEERDAQHFDGIERINVIIEPDKGGESVKKWLGGSSIRDRVWLVDLGEDKDPSGLYLADPEHFKERWQAALDAAVRWTEHAAAQPDEQRRRPIFAQAMDSTELTVQEARERFTADLAALAEAELAYVLRSREPVSSQRLAIIRLAVKLATDMS
jgi:hypothetical protein